MGGWHASQDKLTQPARGNLCTYRHVCGSPGHQQSHPLPPSPLSCRRTHLRSWLLWAVVPLGLPLLARPLSSRRWLPLPVLASLPALLPVLALNATTTTTASDVAGGQ